MTDLEEASLDEENATKNNVSKQSSIIYYLLTKQDGEELKFFIRFIAIKLSSNL